MSAPTGIDFLLRAIEYRHPSPSPSENIDNGPEAQLAQVQEKWRQVRGELDQLRIALKNDPEIYPSLERLGEQFNKATTVEEQKDLHTRIIQINNKIRKKEQAIEAVNGRLRGIERQIIKLKARVASRA